MTSEAAQTRGLAVVRMGLVRSVFESAQPLILDPVHQPDILAATGKKPELSVTVAQRHELGDEDGQVGVFLQVEATIKAGEKVIAVANCEFAAFYVMGKDCEITKEQLIDTFAPAHLFAFCREHIGDLARRACGYVILPPAHFAVIRKSSESASVPPTKV